MKIEPMPIKIRDLIKGYTENPSTGEVIALNGTLDVRPKYQREYVYEQKESEAVIDTVIKGFPLNSMYWCVRPDGTYEVMDGQQCTISICRFATNPAYSVKLPAPGGGANAVNFPNLFEDVKERFLRYELMVFVCDGTESEKMSWFQTINIAGKELSKQEIRNAIYACEWLTDAKSLFSREGCVIERKFGKFLSGKRDRQEYLETAFRWLAARDRLDGSDPVATYMQLHRQDKDASELLHYFESVFKWAFETFGKTHPEEMKKVEWGLLYNEHKDEQLDSASIRTLVDELMANPEIRRRQGIFEYALTREERVLNLREFSNIDKRSMFEAQGHRCNICGKICDSVSDMHADHIKPWYKGGRTELSNGQMLCVNCNLSKGAKSPAS